MDTVTALLHEWGLETLVEIMQFHEIDEEALLLLDKESIRALVPKIGLCVKLENKISEYRQKCHYNNITEVLSANDSHQEAAVSEIQDVNRVEPSSLLISLETFDSLRPTATKFDVATVVMDKCPEIGDTLKSGNPISYLEKLRLSRALVKNCLVKECGVFPTSKEKELLAKELITAFPSLKGVDGTGYEQWFCKGVTNKTGKTTPNRGYFEENLRNWRQRLSIKDKERYGVKTYSNKGVKRSLPTASSQDIDFSLESLEKQQWLKENSSPPAVVSQYMSETCLERHRHIAATSPSITYILELWPKLHLVNLIDQEFAQIYSQKECDSLSKEFALIARSLLLQAKNCGRVAAEKKALDLFIELGELPNADKLIVSTAEINAALILLPYLLPQGVVNRKKKFRPTLDQTKRHFIDELPEGSNIAEIVSSRTEEDKSRTQPFIVLTGNKFSPSDTYVILEKSAIQTDSLLKAVDICFKLHYLFNVQYSNACSNIYYFLNSTFYKVGAHKDGTEPMPSSVKELRSRLFV